MRDGQHASENRKRKEAPPICVILSDVTKSDDEKWQQVARRDGHCRWRDSHDLLASQATQMKPVLGQQLANRVILELLSASGDFEEAEYEHSQEEGYESAQHEEHFEIEWEEEDKDEGARQSQNQDEHEE
jgi:hypothetical protein